MHQLIETHVKQISTLEGNPVYACFDEAGWILEVSFSKQRVIDVLTEYYNKKITDKLGIK